MTSLKPAGFRILSSKTLQRKREKSPLRKMPGCALFYFEITVKYPGIIHRFTLIQALKFRDRLDSDRLVLVRGFLS